MIDRNSGTASLVVIIEAYLALTRPSQSPASFILERILNVGRGANQPLVSFCLPMMPPLRREILGDAGTSKAA